MFKFAVFAVFSGRLFVLSVLARNYAAEFEKFVLEKKHAEATRENEM